jgi:hypothetical protein
MESNFFYGASRGDHGEYIVLFFNHYFQEIGAVMDQHVLDGILEVGTFIDFLGLDSIGFSEFDKIRIS